MTTPALCKTSLWHAAPLVLLALLAVVACGGSASRPTPVEAQTSRAAPAVTATTRTSQASPAPSTTAVARTTAAPASATPGTTEGAFGNAEEGRLSLTILAPEDGMELHAGAVRVIGIAPQDAAVAVNGAPVAVQRDGSFSSDLLLADDIESIEISASDLTGATATAQLAVFNAAVAGAVPLDVLYPSDGLQVSSPAIEVVGVTAADAAIAVNGIPAAMNALGIFAHRVELSEGANLIEVTATNSSGEVRSLQIAVFYAPGSGA